MCHRSTLVSLKAPTELTHLYLLQLELPLAIDPGLLLLMLLLGSAQCDLRLFIGQDLLFQLSSQLLNNEETGLWRWAFGCCTEDRQGTRTIRYLRFTLPRDIGAG
jgi:hypothetical protein